MGHHERNTMEIPDEVVEALERAQIQDTLLRLPDQLAPDLYSKVDKALKALGGRWDGRKHVRAHRFDQPAERVLALLRTGHVLTPKEKGYVPTPPELAFNLVSGLNIGSGDTVLEPSAGTGAIVDALAVTRATVDAVENDRDHEYHLTRLQVEGLIRSVTWADFLSLTPPDPAALFDTGDRPLYDAVAMNPPFHDQTRHLAHALDWVKPGGQVAAIVSAGITFRTDKAIRELRERLEAYGASFRPLPKDTFADSGVKVHAVHISVTTPEQ